MGKSHATVCKLIDFFKKIIPLEICVFLRRQLDGRLENVSKNFILRRTKQSDANIECWDSSRAFKCVLRQSQAAEEVEHSSPLQTSDYLIQLRNWNNEEQLLGGGEPSRRSLSSFCVEGLDARRASSRMLAILGADELSISPTRHLFLFLTYSPVLPLCSFYWPHLTHWSKMAPLQDAKSLSDFGCFRTGKTFFGDIYSENSLLDRYTPRQRPLLSRYPVPLGH